MSPIRWLVPILSLLVALLLGAAGCEKRPRPRPVLPATVGLTGGDLIFQEDFEEGLARWDAGSANWKVVDGRLYSGDKPNNNKGIWLKGVTLPANVRMEFQATSVKGDKADFEGDIKFEFGGDKADHAAGYIVIFGGWKNTVNTIARHDEHGEGRLAIDSTAKVQEGQTYTFKVVRLNSEVRWFLDDELLLQVRDANPATGGAFGFNNWDSRVFYDGVRIFAL